MSEIIQNQNLFWESASEMRVLHTSQSLKIEEEL